MQKIITRHFREHIEVQQKVLRECGPAIEQCARLFVETYRRGGKVMFCGNGGSAADSQHLAAELVVRLRGSFDRPALAAIALSVDTSILTAGGNDFGFEQIFSRQIEALGQPGDLLVAISTSGNSENVRRAVQTARQNRIQTIGFLGGEGGQLKSEVDLPLVIPSETTARIQEAHITVGHIICELLEESLFPA